MFNIFNICCLGCFYKNFQKNEKDNTRKQKYKCKHYYRQFTKDSSAKSKLNYQKCPVCGTGIFLYHNYKYYSRFKCNSKKYNHVYVTLKKFVFYYPLIQKINSKFNFK